MKPHSMAESADIENPNKYFSCLNLSSAGGDVDFFMESIKRSWYSPAEISRYASPFQADAKANQVFCLSADVSAFGLAKPATARLMES